MAEELWFSYMHFLRKKVNLTSQGEIGRIIGKNISFLDEFKTNFCNGCAMGLQ